MEKKLAGHLATLNLFREPDGSVHITVAEGKGAISELDVMGRLGSTIPNDYINRLVEQAAGKRVLKNLRDQYDAFTAMRRELNEMLGDMFSVEATLKDGPEMTAECAGVVTAMAKVKDRLAEAYDRIFDMIQGDDGQAWSEAERFLKNHAPDLYNQIGMPKQ